MPASFGNDLDGRPSHVLFRPKAAVPRPGFSIRPCMRLLAVSSLITGYWNFGGGLLLQRCAIDFIDPSKRLPPFTKSWEFRCA